MLLESPTMTALVHAACASGPRGDAAGACTPGIFFQEEDGIRGRDVTGVQTCALPIWMTPVTRTSLWVMPCLRGFLVKRRRHGITHKLVRVTGVIRLRQGYGGRVAPG